MVSETASDRFTVALSDDGFLTAVAYRGEDLITVEFYENVVDTENNDYLFTHLWEVRAFAPSNDYPLAMPVEELAELLERWAKADRNFLQGGYENQISERSLRGVPFHRMQQEAATSYYNSEAEAPLNLPSPEELDVCRSAGLPQWFRSSRDMESAFDQLTAVAAYVEAVSSGAGKPVLEAASVVFGDQEPIHVTRLRNLIQFARQNGYLTRAQHGRSGGMPTRKAFDLCEAIRSQARQVGKGEK